MNPLKQYFENRKKLKNARSLCNQVLELCPEINKREIKLKHEPSLEETLYIFTRSRYNVWDFKITSTRAVIKLGNSFFDYDEEIQKAILGHEIAHYIRGKKDKYIIPGFRRTRWQEQREGLRELDFHTGYKLEKWHLMRELYMDNIVVEKGLGQGLLRYFEDGLKNKIGFDETEAEIRIKNLRQRLK